MNSAALDGFLLGAGLIIAIGAQNAFILRQGLLRQHVFILCLICALSDALLITAGIAGMGGFIQKTPQALWWMTALGAGFLFFYGLQAFRRAARPSTLEAADGTVKSLAALITTCLALTFLNPHVYLDTVIMLGGLSARYEDMARISYGLGAVTASFIWFFSLGYGARLLSPVFAKPQSWRVLDAVVGIIMWTLSVTLALDII